MPDIQPDPTFRRHVFFVSGFDPRGVLFIQKNTVAEAEKWSQLTGHPVTTGLRKSIGKLAKAWPMTADLPSGRVETQFEFLQWDDIIREHWDRRNWVVYLRSLIGSLRLVKAGVYSRAIRESWPIAVTMSVPTALVILHTLSYLLLLGGLAGLMLFGNVLSQISGFGLVVAATGLSLWVGANADRYKPDWNARIGLFAMKLAARKIDRISERIEQMADHIIASIDTERPDEALIIGHSFGTALASLLAARILKKRPDLGQKGSALTLVTLGQTQSMIAHMPAAQWFRDELSAFAAFPDFNWLDFSSPPDGACYAQVNVLDFLDRPPKDLPRTLNAHFHKTFSPDRMNAARKERMIMHFFYLNSPDIAQLDTDFFDFISLIIGPISALARFGRRPSAKAFFTRVPKGRSHHG